MMGGVRTSSFPASEFNEEICSIIMSLHNFYTVPVLGFRFVY